MTLFTYLHEKRGRTSRLAEALGLSIAMVSMWSCKRRRIPAEYCFKIRQITGVPLKELRKDLFGRK